ncbi:hypothetical protein D8674_033923 [Pyrus ussuriensis x Pyrus communis]|uniref:Uncharacterized protein n=1 Tax=Pyrus ussuriensis x Pyrus communis TaxID=2448454 RepID=A0A5N5HNE4_9ROSA|nr:hypothetical protein D8674_033923 [Pyrus ussuriensis x Pyrus communis]
MDDSVQNEPPETPKQQVVRRKLVQTTLFPLKPQQQLQVNGDLKAERWNAGDDEGSNNEDFCGSQSKTKRNSKGNKTPPIKAPKKNSTPKRKKNGTEVKSEDAPRVINDLRLEARLKAEIFFGETESVTWLTTLQCARGVASVSRFANDNTKMQESYGSLLFDVEAGHLILPNILPWDLPSQLSDLVEKEITKALSRMEESPSSMEVIEENLHEIEVQYSLDMPCNGMESLEAKKVEMLSRNGSFSNDLGAPFPSCRRNVRSMHAVLMSDSEDEFMTNGYPTVTDNNEVLGVKPLSVELPRFGAANIDGSCECSETADEMHISETCNSVGISCVPESSFVPETEIDNMPELSSQTVSSDHVCNAIKRVSLGDE